MVSRFIQSSYQNIATNFIEVELIGYYTSKIDKIFSFIESYRFTVKK